MSKVISKLVIVISIMGLCIFSCNKKPNAETIVHKNESINQISRFIAGFPLKPAEKLYTYTQKPEYKNYQKQINEIFNRSNQKNLTHIKNWAKEHVTLKNQTTLFYPFSGPDMLNALSFFPDFENYILAGLEKVGDLNKIFTLSDAQIQEALNALRVGIMDIMGLNFFRTIEMSYQIGSHALNGVDGVMLFFITRMGYDILDLKNIELSPNGSIAAKDVEANMAKGTDVKKLLKTDFAAVEITFTHKNQNKIQKVYYFKGDISDRAFAQKTNLYNFIMSFGSFNTFLKAASYLMYNSSFDDVRSIILSRSDAILFEISGFPYHYIKSDKNRKWQIQLYGQYEGPIPLFANRCQPLLKKDIKEKSLGKLPFSFGYNYNLGYSHLILATRNADFPIEKPVLDSSDKLGDNTSCINDKESIISTPAKKAASY